jgi:O-antigen/teichoic acid export membrane protein
MGRVRINLVVSLGGQGWTALVQLAVIPFYIRVLGIEAYGLIGFYSVLQAVLMILDLGVSPMLNRELARRSARPELAREARDLVRTLEIGYWVLGLAIGSTVAAAAPFIASHWINAANIARPVVQRAVTIMGVVTALQWPISFYQGGLLGLQHQPVLNGIRVTMSTVSAVGAVLILRREPTISVFFEWQVVVSAIHLVLISRALWRRLPLSDHPACVKPYLLRDVWRFAVGMSGMTACGLVLTHADKVLVSRLFSLEALGYYSLAGTVANGMYGLINPIFSAIFPRFSVLASLGDEIALRQLYHRGSQLMTVTLMPLATLLWLFALEILMLWTGNLVASRSAAPIVGYLVMGTAVNGLMTLPYALQLAHGWTDIGVRIASSLVLAQVPAIILLALLRGPVGTASVWLGLNLAYMAVGVPLTHRRLLPHEMGRWLGEDVLLPASAALAVVGVGRWLLPRTPGSAGSVALVLTLLLLGAFASAALAASEGRQLLRAALALRRQAIARRGRI